MAGYAVSGFVDGFFKGRDWRDGKEDRKLDRERQKRLDKLDLERHNLDMGRLSDANRRQNEAHGVRMDTSRDAKAERERQRKLEAEERDFFKRMSEGLGATRPGGAEANDNRFPVGSPVDAPQAAPAQRTPVPAQPKLGYGAMPAQDDVMAGGGASDQVKGGLLIRPAGTEDRLTDGSGVREIDREASAYQQDVQGVQRKRDVTRALSRIQTDLATGGSNPVSRGFGAVSDYFTETPAKGKENAASRKAAAEAHKWYQSGDAQEFFEANPDQLEAAAADPVAFFQGKDGTVSPELQRDVAAALSGPKETSPTNRTGVAGPDQSTAASVDTAERVALSFGLKPGENFNKGQIDRGSKAYVERYYDTVVPQMVEFYMGRGELDKAQAYIDLVESRQGKEALKGIGRATFKSLNGDYDGAANDMLDAFKQYGIADPSMDVDEEATGVIKDDNGKPIGGKVVFVDQKTGNSFEKTFASPDEFIEYGHLMVNPATVAEMLTATKPEPKGAITQQDVLKAATDLVEQTSLGGQPMTLDQAIAQVMQSLGTLGASTGASPAQVDPPLYRPGQ